MRRTYQYRVDSEGNLLHLTNNVRYEDGVWRLIYDAYKHLFNSLYFHALRFGDDDVEYFIHKGAFGLTCKITRYFTKK